MKQKPCTRHGENHQRGPGRQSQDASFIAYGQPVIVFIHAEIVDGTGGAPKYGQTLIIKDGRIAAIGSHITVPQGATVIDAHGKTLLPGFVMVHEHLFYTMGKGNYASLLYTFPRLYLAGGTTTARIGGSMTPYGDINLKLAIDKGDAVGPDLDVTGPYLNGAGLPILKMHVLTGPRGHAARLQKGCWLRQQCHFRSHEWAGGALLTRRTLTRCTARGSVKQ